MNNKGIQLYINGDNYAFQLVNLYFYIKTTTTVFSYMVLI